MYNIVPSQLVNISTTDAIPPSVNELLILRAGDIVQVKNHVQITATLDRFGVLDGLPFMPEMVRYCKGYYRVAKVAHKTCDEHTLRSLSNIVHLEGVRCDGQNHGKCGNACLLFWKTAWLQKVDSATSLTDPHFSPPGDAPDPSLVNQIFECQATQLSKSTVLSRLHLRQYWNDLRSGNVPVSAFLHAIRCVFTRLTLPKGACGETTPAEFLGLKPGDIVEVKSKREIVLTLDARNTNRGLRFLPEMFHYCDRRFQVLQRVRTRIDPDTGRLMELKNACVLLDGLTCRGGYLLCPRANYLLWREVWLKRSM